MFSLLRQRLMAAGMAGMTFLAGYNACSSSDLQYLSGFFDYGGYGDYGGYDYGGYGGYGDYGGYYPGGCCYQETYVQEEYWDEGYFDWFW